jgi:tetratricopeptide (TPR) repeat protein
MTGELYDVARHGVDGGVGKLVTINDCTYRLARLLRTRERETEYAAVNTRTGLVSCTLKVYPPRFTQQEIDQDAEQRLSAGLTLKALGLPVLRADVVAASCGTVRLQLSAEGRDDDDEPECSQLMTSAFAQYRAGKPSVAIKTCQAIAEINGNHTDAMALHAQCLLALSDPDGGMEIVRRAIELEPNDGRLYALAAECAIAQGYFHLAMLYLSDEIKRYPGDIEAAERLVELLLHELLAEDAVAIVKRYRDRLSPDAAPKLFAAYDARIEAARRVASHITHILTLQEKGDWQRARAAWQALECSGRIISRLNLETCHYHLGERIDLDALREVTMHSHSFLRAVALTLLVLGAAAQGELSLAVIAARAIQSIFTNPMDLTGVPVWTEWHRYVSGRPEPVIAALRGLAKKSPKDELLFTAVAQHFERYAQQIGSRPLLMNVMR